MSTRSFILLALAGLVAFGTANMIRNRLSDKVETSDNKKIIRVLVASQNISQGSFVQDSKHFEWVEWPENMVTDAYLLEGKIKSEDFNGAVVRRTILKGEPIAASILVKSNEGGFMSAVLQPKMRAISIAVDATTGNAGFIFPGDRVDLIITHAIQAQDDGNDRGQEILTSRTFIENARILAVDQKLDNPENTAMLANTVTLEVSRKQAEKINVAKDMGKISLSLRALSSGTEPATSRKHGYTRDSDISPILAPRPTSVGKKVQVFHGSKREEIEF